LDIRTRKTESCAYSMLIREPRLQDLFFFTHSFACKDQGGVREELFNLTLMKSKTRVKHWLGTLRVAHTLMLMLEVPFLQRSFIHRLSSPSWNRKNVTEFIYPKISEENGRSYHILTQHPLVTAPRKQPEFPISRLPTKQASLALLTSKMLLTKHFLLLLTKVY